MLSMLFKQLNPSKIEINHTSILSCFCPLHHLFGWMSHYCRKYELFVSSCTLKFSIINMLVLYLFIGSLSVIIKLTSPAIWITNQLITRGNERNEFKTRLNFSLFEVYGKGNTEHWIPSD